MLSAMRVSLFGLAFSFLVPTCQGQDLDSLKWLAGSWTGEVDGDLTEEIWMAPKGKMMLGVNRTVYKNGKASFEFMRIALNEKGIVFYAMPSGKAPVPFQMLSATGSKVVFENQGNDFPQRIIYEKVSDTLVARIEGSLQGKTKSMEWKWHRSTSE